MPPRANKPISVTLGPLAAKAEARVKAGDYASISEVVRAGLRALDREEAVLDRVFGPPLDEETPEYKAWLKAKIGEALDDPRPPVPADEVERRLKARHEARLKRGA
jgi:antitoxin ParD1/3/4